MGGVIHILTRRPERRTLAAEARFGNRKTAKLDLPKSIILRNDNYYGRAKRRRNR